jgi:hypothetical protein
MGEVHTRGSVQLNPQKNEAGKKEGTTKEERNPDTKEDNAGQKHERPSQQISRVIWKPSWGKCH